MIGKAVYNQLSNNATIVAVVGERIYPLSIPQGESLPAIVYQVISEEHDNHVDGSGGLAHATVQISCYATSYAAARNLAETIRVAITGDRGTYASIEVTGCLLESDLDIYHPPADASDVGVYQIANSYSYWYREAIPA